MADRGTTMNPEILSKLNNLAYQMLELQKELRNDPSAEAQFCVKLLGSSVSTMDMQLSSQFRDANIKPEARATTNPATESEAPAAPKVKK